MNITTRQDAIEFLCIAYDITEKQVVKYHAAEINALLGG